MRRPIPPLQPQDPVAPMTIRTRFAPSPTVYLHIGGLRTALFNRLLTRRLGDQDCLGTLDREEVFRRIDLVLSLVKGR